MKPKRKLISDVMAAAKAPVTPSRDNVITLATEPSAAPPAAAKRAKGGTRHSYHASLYLPAEAAFALREIALAKRYKKPHTVLLEAMAELFALNNKSDLAAEIRERMAREDSGVTR